MRDTADDAAPDRFTGQFALAPVTERQIALFRRLAGQRHERADLLGRERRRRPRARRVFQSQHDGRFRRAGQPASAPVAHRLGPNAKLTRDLAHLCPARRAQNHLGPFGQTTRRLLRPSKTLKRRFLLGRESNRGGGNARHGKAPDDSRQGATLLAILPALLARQNRARRPNPDPISPTCGKPDSPPTLHRKKKRSQHFRRGVLVHANDRDVPRNVENRRAALLALSR